MSELTQLSQDLVTLLHQQLGTSIRFGLAANTYDQDAKSIWVYARNDDLLTVGIEFKIDADQSLGATIGDDTWIIVVQRHQHVMRLLELIAGGLVLARRQMQ